MDTHGTFFPIAARAVRAAGGSAISGATTTPGDEAHLFGVLAADEPAGHARQEQTTRVLPSLDWPAGGATLLLALRAVCAAMAEADGAARERLLGEARAAVRALGAVL